VKLADLRQRFEDWCKENRASPESGKKFGEWLGKRYLRKVSNGTWYHGVALRESVGTLEPSEP
jgi:hypothetical protein